MNFSGKKPVVLCFILFLASTLFADPWKLDLNLNLGTTVNSYTDNWTGGEAGSFTWTSQFLGTAEKQVTSKINTKTTLKLQFGQTAMQDKATKQWKSPQKSTDLIDGEELLRYTMDSWVDPYISFRAIGQFVDASDSLFTRYSNPWDLTEGIGASRTLKKSDNIEWATRLGGAARQVINRRQLDAAGNRPDNITNDGGVEFNMDLKAQNKEKWVLLLSSLRVYEALASSKTKETKGTVQENYWRYPHVKWENTLTLTFAKYLMLNLSVYAYYDKDISGDARLKETLSAGLTYTYSRK